MAGYKCGKCGSGALYLDEDRINNFSPVACMICGNRYPPGPRPVKVEGKNNKSGDKGMAPPKGTCSNCGRGPLTLMAKELCDFCYRAQKGLEGEERVKALADAVEKLRKGGRFKHDRNSGNCEKVPDTSTAKTVSPTGKPEPGSIICHQGSLKISPMETCICLDFSKNDKDEKLYDAIINEAQRTRRDPDQMILFMVEEQMKFNSRQ